MNKYRIKYKRLKNETISFFSNKKQLFYLKSNLNKQSFQKKATFKFINKKIK